MDRREFLVSAGVAALSVAGSARAASGAVKKSVEDTPVILECAINGSTTKARNPVAPETVEEHTAEIIQCLDAGATIIHSHSNRPNQDPKVAARFYMDSFRPVWKKHPHAILYATANFDPKEYNRSRTVWPGEVQCGHHRLLAEAGLANMVLLDTGVAPVAAFDKQGVPGPDSGFFWYGFWPEDVRYMLKVCKDLGTGASISVFEPGWMKNVVAMFHAGTLPRGSKLNIYFASDRYSGFAPPIPEALDLYLADDRRHGLEVVRRLHRRAERHGHPSRAHGPRAGGELPRGAGGLGDGTEQPRADRARQEAHRCGRPPRRQRGADAIEYLDIAFPATRPKA